MKLLPLLPILFGLAGCVHLDNRANASLEEFIVGSWSLASVDPELRIKSITGNTFYPDRTWDEAYFDSSFAKFEPDDFEFEAYLSQHPEEKAKHDQQLLLERSTRTWRVEGNTVYLFRIVSGTPQLDHFFRVSGYGYGSARLCARHDRPKTPGHSVPYIRVSGSKYGAPSLWFRR